eukprot:3119037-Amphidinium_carterae.1
MTHRCFRLGSPCRTGSNEWYEPEVLSSLGTSKNLLGRQGLSEACRSRYRSHREKSKDLAKSAKTFHRLQEP